MHILQYSRDLTLANTSGSPFSITSTLSALPFQPKFSLAGIRTRQLLQSLHHQEEQVRGMMNSDNSTLPAQPPPAAHAQQIQKKKAQEREGCWECFITFYCYLVFMFSGSPNWLSRHSLAQSYWPV